MKTQTSTPLWLDLKIDYIDENFNKVFNYIYQNFIKTYKSRATESRYAREVSLSEIKENGYNLNITRYVNLSKDEEAVDLAAVQAKLVEIEKDITTARDKHNMFPRELGLKEII